MDAELLAQSRLRRGCQLACDLAPTIRNRSRSWHFCQHRDRM